MYSLTISVQSSVYFVLYINYFFLDNFVCSNFVGCERSELKWILIIVQNGLLDETTTTTTTSYPIFKTWAIFSQVKERNQVLYTVYSSFQMTTLKLRSPFFTATPFIPCENLITMFSSETCL